MFNDKRFLDISYTCIFLLFCAIPAQATSLDSSGLLDDILHKFFDTAGHWQGKLVFYASWLFWTLTLLSMVWTFGMLALKNAGISEILAEVVRFLAITSFFWWLLINGPAISSSIILSMQKIAAEASGISKTLSPSGIVDIGFDIVSRVIRQSSFWSPVDSIVGIMVAGIILVVLSLVSVNMLLLLISGWILSYAGVFLLGFGGGNWTSDIAINYYKTVLGVAIQIFAMILLVGIGKSFIDQYYSAVQTGSMDLRSLFVMLVVSIILLTFVNKIPPMLASIIGSGGSTMGIGNFGASAALSGAAIATAAAATVGSAAVSGASSSAGGASALKSAFQQAQQHIAEGSGLFSGSRGQSGSKSNGGFKSAMNTAGRFAADMGATLAKGSIGVAKDKIESIKDAAKERIGETTGGKVASKIKDLDSTQSKQDSFTGDRLGAGKSNSSTMTAYEEVSNFVNKNHQI